ncbi:lectin-like domain-containing protein [Lapidilactobacillus luobeiensis]|uniref:lectin-like domain-containing protein n=1 Tax=Lapidilactobacillus luobeiensis TaxID=2950371 RepID=UPI0021C2703B|nr:hypothetical protein [Lapidilactobacillus luobeiensis]
MHYQQKLSQLYRIVLGGLLGTALLVTALVARPVQAASTDYLNPSAFLKAGNLADTGHSNDATFQSDSIALTTGANNTNTDGGSTGAVWSTQKIDLTQDQTFEFELNFGTSTSGNEGMAFVLQNDANGANAIAHYEKTLDGQSLGVWGVDKFEYDSSLSKDQIMMAGTAIQNSVAFEFDTMINNAMTKRAALDYKFSTAGQHLEASYPGRPQVYQAVNDISTGSSFMALFSNTIPNTLTAEGASNRFRNLDLTNGNWHNVKLKWTYNSSDTSKCTMALTLDNSTTNSYTIDASKLNGTSVYWGFTGATNSAMPGDQKNQIRLISVPGVEYTNRKLTITKPLAATNQVAQNQDWSENGGFTYQRTDNSGEPTSLISDFNEADGLTLHWALDKQAEQTVPLTSTSDFTVTLPKDELTLGQHQLKYSISDAYGHQSASETTTINVLTNELSLVVSPSVNFLTTRLNGASQLVQRSGVWTITVTDGRLATTGWALAVQATPVVDGQNRSAGYLVFVNSGMTTNLENTNVPIVSTTERQWQQNWAADQGILLHLNSNAIAGHYQSTITWTLSNTP